MQLRLTQISQGHLCAPSSLKIRKDLRRPRTEFAPQNLCQCHTRHMEAKTSEVRNCLCLQSRRAARHLTQIYDQALRPCGLRVTQFQLLAAVNEAQPVTQQTLSAVMGMDRTTLTRNLALLKREGLIQIEAGRGDHRERVHRLTAAGRRAVAEAFPLWWSAQESVVEQISAGPGQPSRAVISRLLGVLGDLPIDFSVNS